VFVGAASEVPDQMLAGADEADVDGFNLVRTLMPESLEPASICWCRNLCPGARSRPPPRKARGARRVRRGGELEGDPFRRVVRQRPTA